jgi:diguanylate cyclase (GGDEF)-like protein
MAARGMISLKRHIDDFQDQGQRIEELEASYKSALEGIEENLPSISEQLVAHFRKRIRELRAQFESQPAAEILSANRQKLREELRAFATQADKILENKDKQFREILRSFAEAATTLAKQNTTNNTRLTGSTRNLEALVGLQDLAEIRRRIVKEVADLKQAVAEIHDASQRSVMKLHAELRQFQEKLARSEEIARTDTLTGLYNRRAGEQALSAAVSAGRPFSIVLVDLNGFKGINDRWGHPAGDAVLVQFARRIGSAVRAADLVCRWGGDEFLVLLAGCSLAQASLRSQEVGRACEGEYRLAVASRPITLLVRVALGVASWVAGEQIEMLIQRADDALYKNKGKGPRWQDDRCLARSQA